MALRVPSLRSFQSNRGFALLITLTMLAFIVLMLVGLAAYTRVETSVAGNTQRQAQARENALLALTVAVGQLQKYAGVDTAITATAEGFGGRDGTRHYTGVWPSTYVPPPLPSEPDVPAVAPTPEIPLTWLVSGNEFTKPDTSENAAAGSVVPDPLVKTPAQPGTGLAVLVGSRSTATNSTRNDRWVEAPLVDLTANGVPGTSATAPTVIGRYAWWVGDQGVKAPVAVPLPENSVSHQFAQGGPGVSANGTVVFDAWDGANPGFVDTGRIGSFAQLAFLRANGSTQLVGPASLRQNFHVWNPNNYAVLADTKRGGLRQDLSLDPGMLGETFKAWTNFSNYMEPPQPAVPLDPDAPPPTTPVYSGPTIFPDYEEGITLRRRYWMVPRQFSDGVAHSVAPVLSFFGISFSVREAAGNPGELELAARCGVGLWNPYTSALLPENLKVEIRGLPDIAVQHSSLPLPITLNPTATLSGGNSTTLTFALPWVNAEGVPDTHSWLPGRVYNWASVGNNALPANGNEMAFHQPDLTAQSGTFDITRATGIPFPTAAGSSSAPTRSCSLVNPGPVVLTIRVLRASDDAVLGEYTSPPFDFSSPSTPLDLPDGSMDFGFVFRLPDLTDGIATGAPTRWLTTAGLDPRESVFPSSGFTYLADNLATSYGGPGIYGFNAVSTNRLLEREATAQTFDKDAPVFELPRTAFLSVGGLQHLQIPGERPFAIGNPWGSLAQIKGMTVNSLFDRYFFSGLTDGTVPATTPQDDILLPNFLLKPLRKADHSKVTADDMRRTYSVPNADPALPNDPSPAASRSSKFFLQSAAFNLNSTNPAAWASVLSAMRIPGGRGLNYLNAAETTGTAADSETLLLASSAPHYFRFAQSAAETFQTASDPAAARTSFFRKGVRSLSSDEIGVLANAIATRIKNKHGATDGTGGPFRSIEEFLAPFGNIVDADGNTLLLSSVLDGAIADSGLNSGIPEFSSQWLTQADIMSALAPTLFPRSDTFVIRTYGEALNPVTGATEGRAWCEAIVQRLPEYFADPATYPPETLASAFEPVPDPNTPDVVPEATEAQTLNKALGRRFKVVSFRWLTRADI